MGFHSFLLQYKKKSRDLSLFLPNGNLLRDLYWLSSEFPNIQLNVLNCIVQDIDFDRKLVICSGEVKLQLPFSLKCKTFWLLGISINYDKLCICTGAYPKVVHSHPKVIGIRDLQVFSLCFYRGQPFFFSFFYFPFYLCHIIIII